MTPGRRILVAVDASGPSLAAARAAADLAAEQRLELVGIFVEDLDLVSLARLPVALQVHRLTGATRRLDPASLEVELRIQGERARRAVELLARERSLSASFQVVRGEVSGAILAAASAGDLVAIGRCGHAGGGESGLGRTARELVERFEGALLLAPPPRGATGLARIDSAEAAGGRALLLRPLRGEETGTSARGAER